jgi:transposase
MPNYKDYKIGQQPGLFPLDITSLIPKKHLVRQIDAVVDRIDIKEFDDIFSDEGAPSYHPQMMLKVIIYAYSTKNYSCRNIAAMLRQDITYMWLSGMQTPDFNTVNRFRSVYLKDVIEGVFSEVLLFLHEHDFIRFDNYFVDGTKLEADTGKFSHVWKSNTLRYKAAVQARVKTLMEEIDQINRGEDSLYDNKDLPELGEQSEISSKHVEELAQHISNKLEERRSSISRLRVSRFKSKVNKLKKEKENLQKYEEQQSILGQRNSYSKTDHDATMMRMKGTDELRPGYNVQVSSENQFVVNYTVGQNAADSACFTDHLTKITDRGDEFIPENYIGDSGYGCQENYDKLKDIGIGNYLKYPSFCNEQQAVKLNPFSKDNFKYDPNGDFYICLNDKKLEYVKTIQDKTMTGFIQTFRIYETVCCQGCAFNEKCAKGKSYRRIQVNPELERHKRIARENLTSEKGLELRKRRAPEIESFFGDLKHNQKYKRIRLRGLNKADIEIGWLAISYNLRKATLKLLTKAA